MRELIKILAKKHVKEILQYLDNYDEVHFGQIHRDLKIHKGTLSEILDDLVDVGLLTKRRENSESLLPKTYYSLTDYGRKVLMLMKALNMLSSNPNIEVYTEDNKIIVAI